MHYNILLVDKRQHPKEPNWWTRICVYVSTDLERTAKLYANLYTKFLNEVVDLDDYFMYDIVLEEDPNFEDDTGAFKFSSPALNILTPEICKELDFVIDHEDEFVKTWDKEP